MRLFIAVNFNEETRAHLLGLRDELRSRAEGGNFSAPENLHLTLVFLGECDGKQAAAARAAMDAVSWPPFSVKVERVGRFRRDGGDIWWAGLRESEALSALQHELTGKLAAAGFALARGKYSPHITLGREVRTAAVPWEIEAFGERADRIDLMQSERIGGKLAYTAIYTQKARQGAGS